MAKFTYPGMENISIDEEKKRLIVCSMLLFVMHTNC